DAHIRGGQRPRDRIVAAVGIYGVGLAGERAEIDRIVVAQQIDRIVGAFAHHHIEVGERVDDVVAAAVAEDDPKTIPAYPPSSASFSIVYGIGTVRTPAQVRRGIMAARSYLRLKRYWYSAR